MLAFYLLRANRFAEFSSVAGIVADCEFYESLIVFKPRLSFQKSRFAHFMNVVVSPRQLSEIGSLHSVT